MLGNRTGRYRCLGVTCLDRNVIVRLGPPPVPTSPRDDISHTTYGYFDSLGYALEISASHCRALC